MEPLTFVCFKWKKSKTGKQLESAIDSYTAKHVNVLANMLGRHYRKPHRLVCFTDDPTGIDQTKVVVKELWDKHKKLGGCYNRLFTFSKDFGKYIDGATRFVSIDLDCVIMGNITSLFDDDTEDFRINAYNSINPNNPDQYYNGALYMMRVGARKEVWETFGPIKSPRLIGDNCDICIGSDQAWIRLILGKGEARFTNKDGVYEMRQLTKKRFLPRNANIVFFAGKRDPSVAQNKFIMRNWR